MIARKREEYKAYWNQLRADFPDMPYDKLITVWPDPKDWWPTVPLK